jgi:shikimate kinase
MLIFLNGFMGVGKTYWGKQWATQYGFTFIDTDAAIVEKHKASVAEIFATKGEDFFRQAETNLIQSLQGASNTIVACGGGTCAFNGNIQLMNNLGITVFLKDELDAILSRLIKEIDKRPLLKNSDNVVETITTLYKSRLKFYEQCKLSIAVKNIDKNTFSKITNHA